jgi:hypothetical protein
MYVDPGSGMLIYQALMAGVFGAAFYFRKFIARITFRGKDKDAPK